MIAPDIHSALERLRELPVQSTPTLDPEVEKFFASSVLDERTQELKELRIRSERDLAEFARRVAAIANGAALDESEYGMLLFRKLALQVRSNVYDASSAYLRLNLTSGKDRDELSTRLNEMLNEYLQPKVKLQVVDVLNTDYSYLRVFIPDHTPTYYRASGSTGWEVLVWVNSGKNKWQVQQIDSSYGRRLFGHYLQIESRSLEYELHQEDEGQLPSERRLSNWEVRTVDDFVAFLLTELLSNDISTRVLATRTLSHLKTVKANLFSRLARLLLGLVEDEIEIAVNVIQLLSRFGDRQIYHFLLRNYSSYPDLEIRAATVQCLGEISPVAEKAKLIELWESDRNEDLRPAFNHALTRVFERSNTVRFDEQIQEQFMRKVYEGEASYQSALEFLEKERGNICSSYEHYGKIFTLLEFADLLRNRQIVEAQDKLCAYRKFDEVKDELSTQDLENKIIIVGKVAADYDLDEQKILVSLWKLERLAERRDADGFVILVARIAEPLLLYGLKKYRVVMQRAGDYNRLDSKWVAENSGWLSNIKIKYKKYDEQPLQVWFMREVLKELIRNQANEVLNEEENRLIEVINKIAPLAAARNKLSHEGEVINIDDFEKEFGPIRENFDLIRDLFLILTEKDPIENPIRNIPADVRSMLDRESLFPVSIEMYTISSPK